jgi:AraC-type DNA-binding domain-containing proteins
MIIIDNGQMIDHHIKSDFPIKIRRVEYYKPGPILKKHWHKEFMIFYIEKGWAVIHCNSAALPVKAGDLVIINCNDIHYVENCCDHLIERYVIVDFAFLLSHRDDICQTKYIVPLLETHIRFQNKIENDEELKCQVVKLIQEYERRGVGYELRTKANLYLILVSLLERHQVPAADKEKLSHQQQQLYPVLQYIEEHYSQKIMLKDLSAIINMSPHHLCRLFKKLMGMPPIEYINHLRINEAMKLLREHHLSVSEASMIVGFNDSNYFSRLFKKYHNISPKDIRRS